MRAEKCKLGFPHLWVETTFFFIEDKLITTVLVSFYLWRIFNKINYSP